MKFFHIAVAATLLCTALIRPASAVSIFVEGPDAGSSISTAADTSSVFPLYGIRGALSLEQANGPDFVDMFRISLGSDTFVKLSTGSGASSSLIADPVLYLFNSSGVGVAMDDESGGFGQGKFGASLLAGTYYLAIAFAGVEPLDVDGNSIFDVYGSLGVISMNPLASWLEQPFALDPSTVGAYRISVPEPGTLGLMLLSFLGLGGLACRRGVA
jgi:hypothetical protein